MDVHINVSQGPQLHSESQIRINQAMHTLSLASSTLDRLEVICFISDISVLAGFWLRYCGCAVDSAYFFSSLCNNY